MFWKFIISLPESYQISEIHSYYHRRIKQESDYLAIRSGSEPLCDICISGGNHFHARRVLAGDLLHLNKAHCEVLQGHEISKTITYLVLYIFIYFLVCLFGSVMRCTSKGWKNTHIQTNYIMWTLCKCINSLIYKVVSCKVGNSHWISLFFQIPWKVQNQQWIEPIHYSLTGLSV